MSIIKVAVNYYRKTSHLRFWTVFWICLDVVVASLLWIFHRNLRNLCESTERIFWLGWLFQVTFDFNPFVPNAPFLCPLKTTENRRVFWWLQGVEKRFVGNSGLMISLSQNPSQEMLRKRFRIFYMIYFNHIHNSNWTLCVISLSLIIWSFENDGVKTI